MTPTRLCARCAERKTVRGIWYLVALPGSDEPAFFCETCFAGRGAKPPDVAGLARSGVAGPTFAPGLRVDDLAGPR